MLTRSRPQWHCKKNLRKRMDAWSKGVAMAVQTMLDRVEAAAKGGSQRAIARRAKEDASGGTASQKERPRRKSEALAQADEVVSGEVTNGAQDHFYLETQVSLAVPGEGDTVHVHSSTQHPTEVQKMVSMGLAVGA